MSFSDPMDHYSAIKFGVPFVPPATSPPSIIPIKDPCFTTSAKLEEGMSCESSRPSSDMIGYSEAVVPPAINLVADTQGDKNADEIFIVQTLLSPDPAKNEEMQREEASPNCRDSSSGGSVRDGSPDKKSKQEKNRDSARKCRQRKKAYIVKLEIELKEVKEELKKCKDELNILKSKGISEIDQQFCQMKEQLLAQAKELLSLGKSATPQLSEILGYLNVRLCFKNDKIGSLWNKIG